MNDELQAALKKLPQLLEQYRGIRESAQRGEYAKALELLKASEINESTKDQLSKALITGDKYLIDRIIEDLDMRVSQALCWECWRE